MPKTIQQMGKAINEAMYRRAQQPPATLGLVLGQMPLPSPDAQTKLYRHALPINLVARVDALRERHPEHPEITAWRKDTVAFALQLLLALEGAIF